MKDIKTRDVEKYLYVNYLRRSRELLKSAKRCMDDSIYAAASLNAVFSAVAAIDAVCVYYLQKRHAGTNHEESIGLFMSIEGIKRQELEKVRPKLIRILKAKNMASYEERVLGQKDAQKLAADAEEICKFAELFLPKE
jgi:HEPN domain-containing protein